MAHPRNLFVAQRVQVYWITVVVIFVTAFFFFGEKEENQPEFGGNWNTSNGEAFTSEMFIPWKIQKKPSRYLTLRLSAYKIRHQNCAGEARKFEMFTNGSRRSSSSCKFMVWISYEGLGNKILSLTSAFVYALLTDRVLLVDRDSDLPQLFCEPFPSWFLPVDFPHRWMHSLNENSNECFGNITKNRCASKVKSLPNVVYMHLGWFSSIEEKSFFCEYEQELLQKYTKWLFIRANAYYVPGLHLVRKFSQDLQRLFPEPEETFGTLARLMLQPTKGIQERTLDYFNNHLAGADKVIGVQMRAFENRPVVFTTLKEQLWSCLLTNNMIQSLGENDAWSNATTNLLVTSLNNTFAQDLQDRISVLKVPGVKVFAPSSLEVQKTGDAEHDKQALEEMLLLSMTDVLITSPRSTFGYVPQGLSGLKPLVLRGVYETGIQELTCAMSHSQDPGFLFNPPLGDCECEGEQLSQLFTHSNLHVCTTDDRIGCLQLIS